jgi:ribosomal protein S18 acetylase RimI-like enzyme
MIIDYKLVDRLEPQDIANLYSSAELNRPIHDLNRLERMFHSSDIIIAAFEKTLLVGIARAISDFAYCTYLSDLAVRKEFQNQGIGQSLITQVQLHSGEESNLILLSSPEAMDYYPKIGLTNANNAFYLARKV